MYLAIAMRPETVAESETIIASPPLLVLHKYFHSAYSTAPAITPQRLVSRLCSDESFNAGFSN